jgi:EmrB/QacA subfamily drug resistance transporter
LIQLPKRVRDNLLYSAILVSFCLVYADSTILSIILPTIQKDLNTSVTNVLWTVNSFMLVRAVFVFAAGRLSDMYTPIRIFLLGNLVLVLSSWACGMATGIASLVVFRALQGVGATFIFVAGMSLITRYAPKDKKARRLALTLSAGLAGMAVGPVAGAFLMYYMNWHWVFFANVILGLYALLVSMPTLFCHEQSLDKGRFDWTGFIFSVIFTTCFTLAFQNSNIWGWQSFLFLSTLSLGLVSFAIFIYVELRCTSPLVQLTLLFKPNFLSSCVIAAFTQICIMFIVFISIFLQTALGYSPLVASLMILPMVGVGLLFANVGGWLADRYGFRFPLIFGTGVAALGFVITICIFEPISYYRLLPLLLFSGIGMFMVNGPIRLALLDQTSTQNHGMVNALLTGFRTILSVIGFSVIAAIIVNVNYYETSHRLSMLTTIAPESVHHLMGLLSQTPESLDVLSNFAPDMQKVIHAIVLRSYINGFFWALVFVGILSCSGFLLAILGVRHDKKYSPISLV